MPKSLWFLLALAVLSILINRSMDGVKGRQSAGAPVQQASVALEDTETAAGP